VIAITLTAAVAVASAQQSSVSELRKENRLPEWANYFCYQDAKKIRSGWFMIVAYDEHDSFKNDSAFGYKRGVTIQEYLGSGVDITAINTPVAPEEYALEVQSMLQTKQISSGTAELLHEHIQSAENAAALAKSARKTSVNFPEMEKELLSDELARALLDAPDGTNYHNFLASHPEFPEAFLDWQKYYNAGIFTPPSGAFKKYREGNVLFEENFGTNVFEGAAIKGSGIRLRLEMDETSSGLRFVLTYGMGIPRTGKCEEVPTK
jgi:hypothetical protein